MPGSFDFDAETAVTAVGDRTYVCELSQSWWVHRGPNGGYLAAIVLRALVATVHDPLRVPRSLTVHYAAPPSEGSLQLVTAIEREGRSLTTCSARIEQHGRLIGLALGAFARPRPGPAFCDLLMPEVPPPEGCERAPIGPDAPAIARRWDARWVVGMPRLRGGPVADEARTACWIRLPEGRVVDGPVAAAITDAAVPAIFNRVEEPIIVPTVDLTVHFRAALPLPGASPDEYVLAAFRTGAVADGFLEEDGEVWSGDGTLLAQSRQLAAVLPLGG